MNGEVKAKLLRDLYLSLDDIRSLKARHLEKVDRLEHEEDMTLIAIQDLKKEIGREGV